jgi:gamma-glutamyltranspeptidase/glutathione hydrolase
LETRATRAAAASESHVAQAAREALTTGNAVDAVMAGVLAAAAGAPGVFLGPLQVLIAGAGAGLIAADGRLRQPGLHGVRPRGALAGSVIPAAARVAVPALPATLATVLASFGTATLRKLATPAIKAAKAEGAKHRASVLDAFSRRGAPALGDDLLSTALLAVAGRAAGGLLTLDDLAEVRPEIASVVESTLRPAGWLQPPWRTPEADASHVHVVAAADGKGQICIACYESPEDGLSIPELGLIAPAHAEPVRRGLPRVTPGEPRPAASPIALRIRKGLADLAFGLALTPDPDLAALFEKLDEIPLLSEAFAGAPGKPVAVVRTREAAMVAASA